jgi:hypothetical protein
MNLTVIFILNYMPQADGRTRLSFYITQDIDTILENIIAQSFRNEDVRLVAKRTLLGLSATMPIVNLPTHGVDEALGRLTDDADFLFEPDAPPNLHPPQACWNPRQKQTTARPQIQLIAPLSY